MNSIRVKLLGSYIFINFFVLLVAVVSFYGFSQIGLSMEKSRLSQNDSIVLTQISQLFETMRNSENLLLYNNDATGIEQFNASMSKIDTLITSIPKQGKSKLAQTLIYVLSQSISAYSSYFNEDTIIEWKTYQDKKTELTAKMLQDSTISDTSQASLDYLYKAKINQIQYLMEKEQSKISKSTEYLLTLFNDEEQLSSFRVQQMQRFVKGIVLIVSVIGIFVSVIISFFMAQSLIKPILQLKEMTQSFADGYLTSQLSLKRKDEFGDLSSFFKSMIDRMRILVLKVQDSISIGHTSMLDLEKSAQNVLDTSMDANNTLELVINNNEKNASELNYMSHMFDQVSKNIDDTNEAIELIVNLTHQGTTLANDGLDNMNLTYNQMNSMTQQFEEMTRRVHILEEKSDAIKEVIHLIQAIGSQTNLLALNASIEAARAGDAGKGFGVVADEIRKLAQATAEATQDIREMLQSIISESHGIGIMVQDTSVEVDKSKTSVENSRTKFADIVDALNDLKERIDYTATGVNTIQKTSTDVLETTHAILDSSQSNLSYNKHIGDNMSNQIELSKETVRICEDLDKQFSHLKELISYFKS